MNGPAALGASLTGASSLSSSDGLGGSALPKGLNRGVGSALPASVGVFSSLACILTLGAGEAAPNRLKAGFGAVAVSLASEGLLKNDDAPLGGAAADGVVDVEVPKEKLEGKLT